ncbi:MAG: mechanosensitive ion channel domain-containing protein [Planctomycetota bacterium]
MSGLNRNCLIILVNLMVCGLADPESAMSQGRVIWSTPEPSRVQGVIPGSPHPNGSMITQGLPPGARIIDQRVIGQDSGRRLVGPEATIPAAKSPPSWPEPTGQLTAPPLVDSTSSRQNLPRINDTPRAVTSKITPAPARFATSNQRTTPQPILASQANPSNVGRLASTTAVWRDSNRNRDHSPFESTQLTLAELARSVSDRNRRLAETMDLSVQTLALRNASLAEELVRLTQDRSELRNRLLIAEQKLFQIRSDYESVNEKLMEYGLTPTIGLLLQHQKQQLDYWQTQDNETQFARTELRRTQQAALELELIPTKVTVGDPMELLAWTLSETVSRDATQAEQHLLHQRSLLATQLKQDYRLYHHDLDALDSAASASLETAQDFRKLIQQHVIWIRSGDTLGMADLVDGRSGLAAIMEFRHTRQLGRDINQKLARDPLLGVALIIGLLAIVVLRWRLKRTLQDIGSGKRLRRAGEARLASAATLTLAIAVLLPLLGFAMVRWMESRFVSETLLQTGKALRAGCLVALALELARQLLRPLGLVDKHLNQEIPTRQRAFRMLTFMAMLFVPGATGITLLGELDHGMWQASLGRFAFLVAMLVLLIFGHLALRPGKGFLCESIDAFAGRLAGGFSHLWYALGVGFPLVMAVLAVLGYGNTANELLKRAILSGIVVISIGLAWKVGRILLANAWQRLTGTYQAPEYDEYGLVPKNAEPIAVNETQVRLKHQIAFLLQCAVAVGVVAIAIVLWRDVVPQNRLANPVLWTIADEVASPATANAPNDTLSLAASVTTTTDITLAHLMATLAILFFTIQLARLLPNVFDVLILQRVDYDEGMEHLLLVASRLAVFATGCFFACRMIGLQWSTIQWLMLGITVGIGFGLQDVVRNLLGGLVVLFGRPVNVGDRITVGKVSGRISAQTLRTTFLTGDDGKQLQIPNKKFLSEDVTNWRGAGKLTTVAIEITVTRDVRTIDVGRMLIDWASDITPVLQSPGPQVTLVCVAKQTQRLEIHVWIEDAHQANDVRDELLRRARRELRERGWLANEQPRQPSLLDPSTEATPGRGRRRSA